MVTRQFMRRKRCILILCFREDTITIIVSVLHDSSGETAFCVSAALHQRSFGFGIAIVSMMKALEINLQDEEVMKARRLEIHTYE